MLIIVIFTLYTWEATVENSQILHVVAVAKEVTNGKKWCSYVEIAKSLKVIPSKKAIY